MHELMPLLVVAVLVLVVAGIIYGAMQARKRQEGFLGLAQRLNLNFGAGQDRTVAGRFGFLNQLAQGSNRYATNVLSGNYQRERNPRL